MNKKGIKKLSVLIISIILIGLFSLYLILAKTEGTFDVSITVLGFPLANQNSEFSNDDSTPSISKQKPSVENAVYLDSNSGITRGMIGLFMGLFSLHIISSTMLRLKKKWRK